VQEPGALPSVPDARLPSGFGLNSINAFGFNVPVLIDHEDKVIAGHGRLLACGELGWTEVPAICLDHLAPEQARAGRSYKPLRAAGWKLSPLR
jgi:hypothetical protein